MAFTDPIGDMITRIRNAQQRGKATVLVPASKFKQAILDVLVEEGYLAGYREVGEKISEKMFEIYLKYNRSRSVIREIKRISKPSVRFYRNLRSSPSVASGLGNAILTTSRGVMSDVKARRLRVGGEILLTVW